jgi:cytochrome d ubiquinol oxidase subunit II
VSYEFQSRLGNLLGRRTYQVLLVVNGVLAPLLLGGAVATFFTGSNFLVDKGNIAHEVMPVISSWANASHGLDALLNPWNVIFGLAVFFLARILGVQYVMNRVDNEAIQNRSSKILWQNVIPFLILFFAFLIYVLVKEGYAVDTVTGDVYMQPYKYASNLSGGLLIPFLLGLIGFVGGLYFSLFSKKRKRDGIYWTGFGVVALVWTLFGLAGYNHTAYYPSTADIQSSLTLANSCASEFTLRTMAYVSFLIPFVLAYIVYAWRSLEKKPISLKEMEEELDKY